jgi:hypothetical protein
LWQRLLRLSIFRRRTSYHYLVTEYAKNPSLQWIATTGGSLVDVYPASQREYRWAIAMAMMQINEITSPTAAMGP